MRIRFLLAGALLALARPLTAQVPIMPESPALQDVVRLAQEGYGDSARKVVAGLLAKTPATDTTYPEMLFTAAIVAKTGEEMRTNFLRVVVEHSRSRWADKALLRLAQLDYGSGKFDGTMEKVTRFFLDYPASPVLPTAALWGARAAFGANQPQQACDWLTRGVAAVGDDVELKNQLLFARQRCDVGNGVQMAPVVAETLRAKPADTSKAKPSADTAKPRPAVTPPARPPVTPPPPAANKPPASPWRVQVAAIADKAAIATLVRKIEGAGYTVYRVPGPRGLTKIQAGPFASRAQATAALAKIGAATGTRPFVTQAP